MRRVPAIPSSTRHSITWRLLDHAGTHWPQLDTVHVNYLGGFAYVSVVLPGGEQIPLCRLRYPAAQPTPSASRSTPRPATATTTPSCAPASQPGTPQEALDTACTIHLAGLS